ncbi:hypothetical protein L7F22_046478 [Adiantum nelumboides]|nr:hypothetical protein [Adiantum nelumboides]
MRGWSCTACMVQTLELYSLYGADTIKNKVCLTPANIFDRVLMFWTYKLQHPLGTDFLDTVHQMIKSGKFYPSSDWITPYQGRGMQPEKIEALWNCMAFPSAATKADIRSIFVLEYAYRNAQPRANSGFCQDGQKDTALTTHVRRHRPDNCGMNGS